MAAPGLPDFAGYDEDEDNELISDDEERAKDRQERCAEEHRRRNAEATRTVKDETEQKLKGRRLRMLVTFFKGPGPVLRDANPNGYDRAVIEKFKKYLLLNERPVDWRRAIEHLALNKRDISSLADPSARHLLNAVKDIKLWLYDSNLGKVMLEELADYFQGTAQPAKRRRRTQYHQYTKPTF